MRLLEVKMATATHAPSSSLMTQMMAHGSQAYDVPQ